MSDKRSTRWFSIRRTAPGKMSRQAAAYGGAMEAVFSLLIALGAGFWIDRKFETEPVFLLVGLVFGFSAFIMRLMRLRRLIVPEDESLDDPDPNGDG